MAKVEELVTIKITKNIGNYVKGDVVEVPAGELKVLDKLTENYFDDTEGERYKVLTDKDVKAAAAKADKADKPAANQPPAAGAGAGADK